MSKQPTKTGSTERGRWTSAKKVEVVLRLLKGEALDAVSRELKVTAACLTKWREEFLQGGQANLKRRPTDAGQEEISRLRRKVGEITMENELLYEKIALVEQKCPPAWRRSRR